MTPAEIADNLPRLYNLERKGGYPPPALEAAAGQAMADEAENWRKPLGDGRTPRHVRDAKFDARGFVILTEHEAAIMDHVAKVGPFRRGVDAAAEIDIPVPVLTARSGALAQFGLVTLTASGGKRSVRVVALTDAGRAWLRGAGKGGT